MGSKTSDKKEGTENNLGKRSDDKRRGDSPKTGGGRQGKIVTALVPLCCPLSPNVFQLSA